MCGCVGYGVYFMIFDNKIYELLFLILEFKYMERMLFEFFFDFICLYVFIYDLVFILFNV